MLQEPNPDNGKGNLGPKDFGHSIDALTDYLCDEYEAAWRQGERPNLDVFLAKVMPDHRGEVFTELLRIDVAFRKKNEEQPAATDYEARFPQYREMIESVFAPDSMSASLKKVAGRHRNQDAKVSVGNNYLNLNFHAEGGLGQVYRAHDERLSREVAIKFLRPDLTSRDSMRSLLKVEAEVTGRLNHPGVVPVYTMGDDGQPFYVMRFIEGETFREAIDRFHEQDAEKYSQGERHLELCRLIEHLVSACDTVAYAHNRGVLHRDIKPDNIMLGKYGETLVVDWGFAQFINRDEQAKASGEKTLMPDSVSSENRSIGAGTIGYISPEQIPGSQEPVTNACDVYSLGATLYKLLTGRTAFHRHSGDDWWKDVSRGHFPRPRDVDKKCPVVLEKICLKAMSLKPQDRYASATELADDLRRWMADEPVSVYRDHGFVRMMRWAKRHRTVTISVVTSVLTIFLVVCILAIVSGTNAKREAANAEYQIKLRKNAEVAEHRAQEAQIANLATTARFAAMSYAQAIESRWLQLERLAADPELIELVTAAVTKEEGSEEWIALENWLYKHTGKYFVNGTADCFNINIGGTLAARSPHEDGNKGIGNSYQYRAYFHGGKTDFSKEEEAVWQRLMAAGEPVLSPVFQSKIDGVLKCAFAVPIKLPETNSESTSAMLSMSISLDKFSEQLGIDVDESMQLVVIDLGEDTQTGKRERGMVLEHPEVHCDGILRMQDEACLERLERIRKLVVGGRDIASEELKKLMICHDYRDTLSLSKDSKQIAAFAPVVVRNRKHVRTIRFKENGPASAHDQALIESNREMVGDIGWIIIIQDKVTPPPTSR